MSEAPADSADIEQLQTTALMIHAACRHETTIRHDALSGPSFRALANVMEPMSGLSVDTVILRTGFKLGVIKRG